MRVPLFSRTYFRFPIILILFLVAGHANGQKLLNGRQSSFYTYIYRITPDEAKEICTNGIWKADDRFLHTPVDSFPTDSTFRKKLPIGHYLKVHTEKNRLRIEFASVLDFDVMILKNNTDLAIRVYDLNGAIIPDADVSVRHKAIRFDGKSQSYICRKSNQNGLLKVTCKGFTAYYDLKRQYNNSFVKRASGKIVYGTPLKYVWLPVRYIIHLPIDGVKSVSSGYAQGTISRTKWFFRKSFYRIACLFDDYYCDYYDNGSNNLPYALRGSQKQFSKQHLLIIGFLS